MDVTQLRGRLRHGLEPVHIPGLSEKLEERSPAINENVLRYVNSIDAADIRIEVQSRSFETGAAEAAQRAEDFFYQLYHDHRRRRSGRVYGAERRALDQQAATGLGVLRQDFRDDIRETLLGKQIGSGEELVAAVRELFKGKGIVGNPFVLECPDLLAVAFTPDLSVFSEMGKKVVSPVQGDRSGDPRRFLASDTMSKNGQSYQREVDVYHLETEEFIYDLIDGGEGYFEYRVNLAGRPSYALIPGHLTADRLPGLTFLPLVGGVYRTVQRLNVLETLANSAALQTGRNMWQQVKVGRQADDYAAMLDRIQDSEVPVIMLASDKETLPAPLPGHEWRPIQPPDMTPLIAAMEYKRRELVDYGFPPVLSPDAPIDAKSGYDRGRLMEAGTRFLRPPLTNLAHAWYELFWLAAEAIKTMDVSVTVIASPRAAGEDPRARREVTVRPDDFQDIELLVGFEWVPETVKFAERESRMRLMAGTPATGPLMSKQTFMKGEYDDWLAEEKRIDLQDLRAPLRALAKQDALQIVENSRQEIVAEEAARAGYPLRAFRPARPPEQALPGVGSPLSPPEQSQDGTPPSLGSEITAEVP